MTPLMLCCALLCQVQTSPSTDTPAIAESPDDRIVDLETSAGLREGYRDVMRRSASRIPSDLESLAVDSTSVFAALKSPNAIGAGEASRMREALRPRLELVRDRLKRSVLQGRQAERKASVRNRARRDAEVPAAPQDADAASLAGGGGTARRAQQLIDLITDTIAPETWEVNGGSGRIMFFRPLNVLVIRASGEVHNQVGDVMGQLRK